MRLFNLLQIISLISLTTTVSALSPAGWRSKSIYQVFTDRFARTDGSTTAACDPSVGIVCGGTIQGIISQLDYIQQMGFTAVRISNTPWAIINAYIYHRFGSPRSS